MHTEPRNVTKTLAIPQPMLDELDELARERGEKTYGRRVTWADMMRLAAQRFIDEQHAAKQAPKRKAANR